MIDTEPRSFTALVRGTAVPLCGCNKPGSPVPSSSLATLSPPLPPLEEQQRIVAEVEQRLSAIDALRAAIERAQRRSAALRRSVLERAFRGELVPQDPSDEPASVLLARIHAEREAAGAKGKRGRKSQ